MMAVDDLTLILAEDLRVGGGRERGDGESDSNNSHARQSTLGAMFIALILTALMMGQTVLDPPIADNDRVNVRERPTIGGPLGSIVRKTDNEIWIAVAANKVIVITLKDKKVAPLPNKTGYPNAFPRPGGIKVHEDSRVIVWDYTWTLGKPTPMHFHNTDVVVIYLDNGTLASTTPDGKTVSNKRTMGQTYFNARDRVHTETLTEGKLRAIITELK